MSRPARSIRELRGDAVLYSVGADATHGARRTNAGKRKAALTLLQDEEWTGWSDSEVARRTGTSHPFVAKVRAGLTCNVSSGTPPEPVRCHETTPAVRSERKYTNRHGNVSTMHTERIGNASCRRTSGANQNGAKARSRQVGHFERD